MKLPNWIQHLRPDNSKPTHLGTVLALFFALSVLVLIIDIVGQFKWMQEIEDNFTIFFLFAAFFSIPIAIWRSTVAEQQAITAQSGLFNERYQKGAEMLGSKVLSVRLGGIYALRTLIDIKFPTSSWT